jgi:hypothetical protein
MAEKHNSLHSRIALALQSVYLILSRYCVLRKYIELFHEKRRLVLDLFNLHKCELHSIMNCNDV